MKNSIFLQKKKKTHLVPGNASYKRKKNKLESENRKVLHLMRQTSMYERVIDEYFLSGSSSCSITLHGEDRNKRVVDPVIHIQRLHYND